MKYFLSIVYDPEYEGYVVDVPQLPGCMTQGKTFEEALANMKEAIELYTEETGSEHIPYDTDAITAFVEV